MLNLQLLKLKSFISDAFEDCGLTHKVQKWDEVMSHKDMRWARGSDCWSELTTIFTKLDQGGVISRSFSSENINPRFHILCLRFNQESQVHPATYVWLLFFYRGTLFTVARYSYVTVDSRMMGSAEVTFQHKGHLTRTTIKYSLLVRDALFDNLNQCVFTINKHSGDLHYSLYYPGVNRPFISLSKIKGIGIRYYFRVATENGVPFPEVVKDDDAYTFSIIPNVRSLDEGIDLCPGLSFTHGF